MRGDAFIHFVSGSRRVNIRLGVLLLIPKSPHLYVKEQTEYIQNQINKIRDSVEDRQSRIAGQQVNVVFKVGGIAHRRTIRTFRGALASKQSYGGVEIVKGALRQLQ